MSRYTKLICAIVMVGLSAAQAQKAVTAKELNANPGDFNGKKVQIYVGKVEFPAMTINAEKGFRDFEVSTREDGYGKPRSEHAGKIAVRVPESEVEEFSREHSQRVSHSGSVQRERITGLFRACKNRSGGYIDLTDGSAQDIDPKAVR